MGIASGSLGPVSASGYTAQRRVCCCWTSPQMHPCPTASLLPAGVCEQEQINEWRCDLDTMPPCSSRCRFFVLRRGGGSPPPPPKNPPPPPPPGIDALTFSTRAVIMPAQPRAPP